MKLQNYMAAASLAACLLIANSANAQWTRVGTNTYLTNVGDNVGIGTTTPAFKLDIQSTGIATMSFKSTTSNASILLDRGSSTSTASLTYRSSGTNRWQTGIVSNDNFTIRNNGLAQVSLFCSYATNFVGIGTQAPTSKLHVVGGAGANDTLPIIQGVVAYTGTYDVNAVYGKATSTAAGWGIGVAGDGNYIGVSGNGGSYGVLGIGGSTGVYGVSAGSSDTTDATGFISHGVDAIGGPGNESAGILAQAGGGKYNYGIIGYCGPTYTPADSDNTHNNWAAYFFGDIVYSRAFRWSDAKLKSNIQPIESALEKLSRVQTSTYNFKTKEFKQLDLPAGKQIGFIAENMEQVFPDLVKESRSPRVMSGGRDSKVIKESVTFKTVNYEGMIPVVVAAINEQSAKINKQESEMNARITQLENEIALLKSMLLEKKANVTETGSLLQNVPNPANGVTTISFYLPENSKGVLQVTDASGKVVKSFNVSGSGMQDVVLNTASLSSGSYTYSLSINGKVADSKSMLISK